MSPDQETVRRLVREQFPEHCCDNVKLLGRGMDCAAWLIDDRCVFRFPQRDIAAECLQNEIRVLPQISDRLSVRISAPRWIGQPTADHEWPFAGYEIIQGRPVCDVTIPDSAALDFASSLAQFLKMLHAINADEARKLGVPEDEWRRLDVPHRCEFGRERLRRAADLGLISDAEAWMTRLDAIEAAAPVAQPVSLVHGDLYSKHVLVDDNFQLAGIIDWGDVHVGHPAVDLAAFWNIVPAAGRPIFLSEYGVIDPDTWLLAELRAIYHSTASLLFSHEIADQPLATRSLVAMQDVLSVTIRRFVNRPID
ncbi:MAG: phosphotransferase [Planctomycetota bacterium]